MGQVVIDFGIDFAEKYSLSDDGSAYANAGIATIVFDVASATLEVNGKPLDRGDNRAIAEACRSKLK